MKYLSYVTTCIHLFMSATFKRQNLSGVFRATVSTEL